MCGRYVNYEDVESLAAALGIAPNDPALHHLAAHPRFNIAPSQEILAVRAGNDAPREGASLHWGLVPSWAKEKTIGNRMINARSETAFEKPSFRSAMKNRRCIIPASGFYEWQKQAANPKQPFFIHRADKKPMLFAGLWERWDKEDPPLESAAILTTAANHLIADIHLRMPVILDDAAANAWLDPHSTRDDLAPLLAPCPDDWLAAHPVSLRVNKPVNDSPDLIEKLES